MSELYRPSRRRERGDLTPFPTNIATKTVTTRKKNVGDTIVSSSLLSVTPFRTGKWMVDIVHDRFKERQAKGQIFNSPMTYWEESVVLQPFSGNTYSSNLVNQNVANGVQLGLDVSLKNWVPDILNFPLKPPYMDTSEKAARTVNSAFAKAHQRYVNFLTDLAEAGQTASLIKGQLSSLDRLLNNAMTEREARASHKALVRATKLGGYPHSMSRRAYKQVLNAGRIFSHVPITRAGLAAAKLAVLSKDAVSAWLQTRYGVVPLLGSITGLVDVLMKQTRPERETFRGNSRDSDENVYTQVIENAYGVPGNTETYTVKRTQYVNSRAGVLTAFHPPTTSGMLGTQLRDIPRTLYDLLPFSFVVDWAFEIGTYIEAATPVPGFSWLSSWLTVERVTETEYTYSLSGGSRIVGVGAGAYTEVYYPQEASVIHREKYKKRRVGVTPRIPKPDFKLVSTTHVLDSVALAFQGLTKTRVR